MNSAASNDSHRMAGLQWQISAIGGLVCTLPNTACCSESQTKEIQSSRRPAVSGSCSRTLTIGGTRSLRAAGSASWRALSAEMHWHNHLCQCYSERRHYSAKRQHTCTSPTAWDNWIKKRFTTNSKLGSLDRQGSLSSVVQEAPAKRKKMNHGEGAQGKCLRRSPGWTRLRGCLRLSTTAPKPWIIQIQCLQDGFSMRLFQPSKF